MAKEQDKDKKRSRPAVSAEKDKVPSLAIPMGDPYIDGVLRHYTNNKGRRADINARPFVLSADDPVALSALENYAHRCNGAGDTVRLTIVRQAIEKFAAFNRK